MRRFGHGSVTALLSADLTEAAWRRTRYEHARELLTASLPAPRPVEA